MWKPQSKHKPLVILVAILIILFLVSFWQNDSIKNQNTASLESYKFSETDDLTTKKMIPQATEGRFFIEQESLDIAPEEPTAGETAADTDQKIIKTGSLQLIVEDTEKTVNNIQTLAAGAGGFVQSASVFERQDGGTYGNITVRVPVSVFEQTMDNIKKEANLVDQETVNAQDVTEEYTDLEAQLHNEQAQEQRYLDILTRAQTVEDILKVERELNTTRKTIERLQGRIQYLKNKTSFSTISVSLEEETLVRLPTESFRPLQTIKEAAQTLVLVVQKIITRVLWFVIVGGGVILPLAIIVGIIVLFIRKRKK